MKKTVLLLGLVIAAAVAVAAENPPIANDKLPGREVEQSPKNLDAKYQNWLNMITYITFKEERKVFLKLTNDRDRDAFIKIFWLQRDPTPGTPENEFKDEIEKRFAYVTEYFKRGTSRPGWMTDQGQIYMTLGKPSSLERFDDKMGLNPAQVWYYYGDASLGLPTYFNVVFYKRLGAGEWKLYNPSSDGPAQLLVQDNSIESNDYTAIYKKIREIAPTLAGPAMSMLPDDIPNNFQPSTRNSFILANIYESPLKKLNVSYATNFLKYKGFVNLETSANFIENAHLVSVSREERYDFNFVTISIRPKKISLGYNEDKDKYYFNLNLNVSLRKGEKIIYQYAKNFEFYFEPDKVGELEGGGVVVHDSFPVIPGEYQLVVFIENTVGKEFTYFDQVVNVPASGGLPYLATPVLGHKEEMENNNFFHPYKLFDKKLSVDPARTFSLNDTPMVLIGAYNLTREMWEKGVVELELKGLNERKKFSRTVNVPLRDQPYAESINRILPIDRSGLVSDYYELKLRLKNPAGIIVDSQNIDFTISPLQKLAHPIETFKQVLADSPYFFYSALGQQCEGAEDFAKADLFYGKCVASNPDFAEGWVALFTIENKLHKYAQVLSAVEKLKEFAKFTFNYHVIKGTALCGLERFDPALDELLEANKIYNGDVRLLNLIGFTFFKLNNMAEALKAFDASLALNGKQPGIEKISAEIKSRIQKNPPEQSAAKK
jgi:GWxTD domain-containing protein